MFELVVCDDEASARSALCAYLQRYAKENGETFHIRQFKNGQDLLQDYPADCDIILIDILMGKPNGIETALQIRQRDPNVCILFITQTPQYALTAYKTRALSYLIKPLRYSDLQAELTEALHRIRSKQHETLVLESKSQVVRLNLRDLVYIEAQNHLLLIRLADGRDIQYPGRLGDLEDQLREKAFFRCHRAYLVNLRQIESVKGNDLILSGGLRVPVSKYRHGELMQSLTRFWGNQL